MELTFIGMIQLAIGLLIVLAGSLRANFAFLLGSGLLGGSAAIILPALGNTSIPPVQFALLFVYLGILAPRGGYLQTLAESISANRALVLFTIYGIASALLAPRLFAGRFEVVPMRILDMRELLDTVPLAPTAQNITAAVYLAGSLLIGLASYVVCRHRGGADMLIRAGIVVGLLHVALGLVVIAVAGTPLEGFFELFRNASYKQTDQEYLGFVRIRGLFPETSVYVEFGFAFFALNAELWYRSIRSRATGLTAIALVLTLFFSTSTTAYLSLGLYGLFFAVRLVALPTMANGAKIRQLMIGLLIAACGAAITVVVFPQLGESIWTMLVGMTVGKTGSLSAQQRLSWVVQGWEAFKFSYGLGIGPGSFRSSSMVVAIAGAMGVIGLGLFGTYVWTVFQPLRTSTYGRTGDLSVSIGGALATAAVIALIPSAVSSARADPGANFAFLAGAALALRPARQSGRFASWSLARTMRGWAWSERRGAAALKADLRRDPAQ